MDKRHGSKGCWLETFFSLFYCDCVYKKSLDQVELMFLHKISRGLYDQKLSILARVGLILVKALLQHLTEVNNIWVILEPTIHFERATAGKKSSVEFKYKHIIEHKNLNLHDHVTMSGGNNENTPALVQIFSNLCFRPLQHNFHAFWGQIGLATDKIVCGWAWTSCKTIGSM